MKVGLVAALDAEGRVFGGRASRVDGRDVWQGRLPGGGELTVVTSGPGMAVARAASLYLIENGMDVLVSAGVAGGLAPSVRTGDIVLAREVTDGERIYRADSGLVKKTLSALEPLGENVRSGVIFTSPSPVAAVEDKKRLFRETGALAVDMESFYVAGAAVEAEKPFFVLRSISDDAERALAPELLRALDSGGTPDIGALIRDLAGRPSLAGEVFTAARDFRCALRALKRAWSILLSAGLFSGTSGPPPKG